MTCPQASPARTTSGPNTTAVTAAGCSKVYRTDQSGAVAAAVFAATRGGQLQRPGQPPRGRPLGPPQPGRRLPPGPPGEVALHHRQAVLVREAEEHVVEDREEVGFGRRGRGLRVVPGRRGPLGGEAA